MHGLRFDEANLQHGAQSNQLNGVTVNRMGRLTKPGLFGKAAGVNSKAYARALS